MKLKRGVMQAAELVDLQWINTNPCSISDLKGSVVLVHFWDYSCVNCLRALSYVKVWYGRYGDRGLSVLGIHAPEFSFGKDRDNVARAVDDLGLEFPVASDPAFSTWTAYSNRYWPASYLIDREGFLSDYQFGEGGYESTESVIQTLLRERDPRVVLPKVMETLRPEDSGLLFPRPVSPEINLGYSRGRIGNSEGFARDSVVDYGISANHVKDVYYAQGEFSHEKDCIVHEGSRPGRITLSYDALDVFLVVQPGPEGGDQGFTVEQDGHLLAMDEFGESVSNSTSGPRVEVDAPRVFHVIHNRECSRHRLVLSTNSPGLKFFCFSFVGSCE